MINKEYFELIDTLNTQLKKDDFITYMAHYKFVKQCNLIINSIYLTSELEYFKLPCHIQEMGNNVEYFEKLIAENNSKLDTDLLSIDTLNSIEKLDLKGISMLKSNVYNNKDIISIRKKLYDSYISIIYENQIKLMKFIISSNSNKYMILLRAYFSSMSTTMYYALDDYELAINSKKMNEKEYLKMLNSLLKNIDILKSISNLLDNIDSLKLEDINQMLSRVIIDIDKSINEQLRIEEENNLNLSLSIPVHESVDSIDFNKYIRSYKIDTKLGRY